MDPLSSGDIRTISLIRGAATPPPSWEGRRRMHYAVAKQDIGIISLIRGGPPSWEAEYTEACVSADLRDIS